MTPFLRQGLARGEKVLYIADSHPAAVMLEHLQDAGGHPAPYLERGQLCIVAAADAYLPNGGAGRDGRPHG